MRAHRNITEGETPIKRQEFLEFEILEGLQRRVKVLGRWSEPGHSDRKTVGELPCFQPVVAPGADTWTGLQIGTANLDRSRPRQFSEYQIDGKLPGMGESQGGISYPPGAELLPDLAGKKITVDDGVRITKIEDLSDAAKLTPPGVGMDDEALPGGDVRPDSIDDLE